MKYKVLKPYYYNSFQCIGGECKYTCCKNWNITIDDNTLSEYLKAEGIFGEKLRNSINATPPASFKLDDNVSCPFLNESNLCDIYINMGEKFLCTTCKNYPRITKKYDDIVEQNLTLSCPEVAKKLVNSEELLDFIYEEYEGEYDTIDFKSNDKFNLLLLGRSISIDILQQREYLVWSKLLLCKTIADKIQKGIQEDQLSKTYRELQSLYSDTQIKEWMSGLSSFSSNSYSKLESHLFLLKCILEIGITDRLFGDFLFQGVSYLNELESEEKLYFIEKVYDVFDKVHPEIEIVFENFLVYFLFRYYMDAYKGEDIEEYITNSILSFCLIKFIFVTHWKKTGQLTKETQEAVLYSYSRNIEHNSKVLKDLCDKMDKEGYTGVGYIALMLR